MFNDSLKSVPIIALERAIAEAVSKLVGKEFECSIDKMDLDQLMSVKMKFVLSEKNSILDLPS